MQTPPFPDRNSSSSDIPTGFDAQDPGFRTEGDVPDSDSETEEDDAVSNPDSPSDPYDGQSAFLSLGHPLDLDVDGINMCSAVSQSEVQGYIYLPKSGPDFSIRCSCYGVLILTLHLDPLEATHKFVPAYLSLDDVVGHFRDIHQECFPDLSNVLSQYGQEGRNYVLQVETRANNVVQLTSVG